MSADAGVSHMVAVVSHDLKSPLNTIQLAASFLTDELIPDTEERRVEREHVRIIQRSVERMNRLIHDLLDVTAAQSGHIPVSRSALPVLLLVDEALETLQPLAEEKRINLRVDGMQLTGAEVVLGDRERLRQVFTNLGENAIKFTPRGGRITLQVIGGRDAVRFAIIDTGPGISAANLLRVFDRFWQAEPTARLGNGLGLAIAKAIIEAHSGEIGVTSTPGCGSTFYFTLPVV